MNKKRFAVMGLLLVVVLVLAACAPKEEMPAEEAMPVEEAMPAEEEMPTEEVEAPPVDESMPAEEEAVMEEPAKDEMATDIDFEALISEKVAGNHDLGRIFNADKTREEWETTLDRMIGYGAKINEEEKQLIIEYLLNR